MLVKAGKEIILKFLIKLIKKITKMIDVEEEESALISKIIAGTTLFIVSIIFGIAPFKLAQIFKWTEPIDPSSSNKSSKVVSVLLCFGGGVLLATTFLHLLPDINAEIHVLQSEGKIPDLHISIGETLMMCGFFLIYLIEEIVHYYLHRYQEHLRKSQMSIASSTMKPEDETLAEAFMRGVSARNSIHRGYTDSNGFLQTNSKRESLILEEDHHDMKTLSIAEKGQKVSDIEKNPVSQMNHNKNNNTTNNNNNVIKSKNHNHGHSHTAALPIHSSDEDMLVSSLRGLLIVLALSIHELFEGFAIGLQKSSFGVYYMFAAVCAHKFVISFCIGVELMVQKTKLWLAFIYVFMYSIVSALGMVE